MHLLARGIVNIDVLTVFFKMELHHIYYSLFLLVLQKQNLF